MNLSHNEVPYFIIFSSYSMKGMIDGIFSGRKGVVRYGDSVIRT